MGKYRVRKIVTMAKIKKASLWIEGRSPLVISIRIVIVKRARLSNHQRLQPKNKERVKIIEAKIKKSSLVSK